jgi:hypothetical protein
VVNVMEILIHCFMLISKTTTKSVSVKMFPFLIVVAHTNLNMLQRSR